MKAPIPPKDNLLQNNKLDKKLFCRLAVLMAEKNPQLSQRQLARNTGLDITTINRLFTNNFSRVNVNTVEALCNYFDKDVGDLLQMRKPEDIPTRKTRKRSNPEQSSSEAA
jgi:putative transcriptional regulator